MMPPKFKRNVSDEDLIAADDTEKTNLLNGDSEEEDFFLRGPSRNKSVRFEDGKLMAVRAQVQEVAGVMRENVEKVLERGDKLGDLLDKSDSMATSAEYFSTTSKRLQRAIWWRDTKMKIILGAVIIAILLLIFIPIIIQAKK